MTDEKAIRADERERVAVAIEERAKGMATLATKCDSDGRQFFEERAEVYRSVARDIRSGALAGEADVAPATEPAK